MARGINLEFVADVAPFLRGTDDIGTALDDVVDSLDDVSTAARSTADDADRSLDDIGTSSKTTADDIEADFRRAFDEVSTKAKTTGTDVDTAMRTSTADAGTHVETFKGEATANFAEVASSFSGDMSSAVGGVQGLLGGLSAALPGIGAAAAGVGAIAVGAAAGIFTKAKEDRAKFAEQTKAVVADLFDSLIEGQGRVDKAAQTRALKEWLDQLSQEDINKVRAAAEELGVTIELVGRAKVGDPKALKAVSDALDNARRTRKAYQDQIKDGGEIEALNKLDEGYQAVNGQITTLEDQLGDTAGAMATATDKYNIQKDAVAGLGTELGKIPPTVTTGVVVDTDGATAALTSWLSHSPKSIDVEVNPVIDEWLWQTTMNKVRANANRYLSP